MSGKKGMYADLRGTIEPNVVKWKRDEIDEGEVEGESTGKRKRRRRAERKGFLELMGITPVSKKERESGVLSVETLRKLDVIEKRLGYQLKEKDYRQILRCLGLKTRHRLMKCPARDMKKAKKLAKGWGGRPKEPWHLEKWHVCQACRCDRVAGKGTAHLGWGWCHDHGEMDRTHKEKRWRYAALHKLATQANNPGLYQEFNRYMEEVTRLGKDAAGRIDLLNEVKLLRSQIKELADGVKDGGEALTDGYDKDGNARPATDLPKLKIVKSLTDSIGRLTFLDHRMNQDGGLTKEEYEVWIMKLAEEVKRRAPNEEFKIVFKEIMRAVGDPTQKVSVAAKERKLREEKVIEAEEVKDGIRVDPGKAGEKKEG